MPLPLQIAIGLSTIASVMFLILMIIKSPRKPFFAVAAYGVLFLAIYLFITCPNGKPIPGFDPDLAGKPTLLVSGYDRDAWQKEKRHDVVVLVEGRYRSLNTREDVEIAEHITKITPNTRLRLALCPFGKHAFNLSLPDPNPPILETNLGPHGEEN